MKKWLVLVLVIGWGGVACDEGGDEEAAITVAAWGYEEYPPPKDLKDGEEYTAAIIEFESEQDIEDFVVENGCGTNKPEPVCHAEAPAKLASQTSVDSCGGPVWYPKDPTDSGLGGWWRCVTCCSVQAWPPSMTCTQRCRSASRHGS